MAFVEALHPGWTISIFHYRNQGSDVGRIVGGASPAEELQEWQRVLAELPFQSWEETNNPPISFSWPEAKTTATLRQWSQPSSPSGPTRGDPLSQGRCLSLAELSELAGCERDEVELALITLMADYAHRDTALEIRQKALATACSCAKTWRLWCRSWCRWTSAPPACGPWPPWR